jgi:uncharacterized cupredoxin-like copper-binding protein
MRHALAVIALGALLVASCKSSYPTTGSTSSSGTGTYGTSGTTPPASSGTTASGGYGTSGTMTSSGTYGTTTPAQQQVQVTLNEYRIDMPETLPTGHVVFHVTNYGSIQHSFGIRSASTSSTYGTAGQNYDKSLTANLDPGQSATLEADLQAGSYTAYCPVGDHVSAHGMTKVITVR